MKVNGQNIQGVRFLPQMLKAWKSYLELTESGVGEKILAELVDEKTLVGINKLSGEKPDLVQIKSRDLYNQYIRVLDSPKTKRIIFDARQAKVFDEMHGASLKAKKERKIMPPFQQHYLELTERIKTEAQEPNESDYLTGYLFISGVMDMPYWTADRKKETVSISQCTFFFQSENGESMAERSWLLTDDGRALIRVSHAAGYSYPEEYTKHNDVSQFPEWMGEHDYCVAGTSFPDLPDRHIGWWERAMISFTNLIFWIWAYTMAKSVEIVEIPLTRQLRRWHERTNKPFPEPWHLVKVKPTFKKAGPRPAEDSGREVGFRFDVIGHLRFNRHRLNDGTYRDTIELIPDHQRGLQYDLYIPKTSVVEQNKQIAIEEMKKYLG